MRILLSFLVVMSASVIFSAAVLLSPSTASAQIVFSPSISYITDEIEVNGASAEDNRMFADFRLGYLHSSGLFLGGMYSMAKYSNGTTSANGFSVGPTLGFSHYSGFFALFTYYIMAEQDNRQDVTQKLTDGMGPQIDIGWAFPITASFHLGPQITYRSVTYDKLETGGASQDIEFTQSHILPAINLWFNF